MIALKREALQHITIVLAGSDSCGLFQLLAMSFGTGSAHDDPFNYLDGASLIKQPLPLTSEDSSSDEEGSTSTQPTASTSTQPSQPAVPTPHVPHVKKSKPSFTDKCELSNASVLYPKDHDSVHIMGTPPEMLSTHNKIHQTTKGGNLYLCHHLDCADQPYSGYGSHFRCVHLDICLGCPYCPDRLFWNVIGCLKHMKDKHASVPWYGSQLMDEKAQAEAMLSALEQDSTAHVTEQTKHQLDQSLVTTTEDVSIPEVPQTVTTMPADPIKEQPPVDTLPHVPSDDDGSDTDESSEEITTQPPTPYHTTLAKASALAPSDTHQWNFAMNHKGVPVSHRPKSSTQSPMTASKIASAVRLEVASPPESLPPPERRESPLHKKRKQDTVCVWPKPETHGGLIYKAPDKHGL